MLLAVDIGNTNVTLGVFEEEKLRVTWHIATIVPRMPDEYAVVLIKLLELNGLKVSDIKDVCLCSVVPSQIAPFEELLRRYFGITPLIVGAGIRTGVRIRMDNPKEVGADRIVHAAAAHHLYGGPCIIVDMGTATTFDTVSKEGDYIGGAIAPGVQTAADALVTHTAQLFRVQLITPKKAIGTNTVAAIQSGIIYGYTGLVEGLITRIQKELGEKAKVVATGGFSKIIAKETQMFDVLNPDLVLEGLRLIFSMNHQV